MRKNFKLLGAVAVAGVVATAGSAFTAGTTMSDANDTVAYGTATVTGATVSTIQHNLNSAGDTIDSVTLTLLKNHLTSTVQAGFSGATVACTVVTTYGDGAPANGYNSADTTTRFTCPVNTATTSAATLAVTVQNDATPA